MTDFETWTTPILGDNPTWRESGSGELARQAYQAGRDSMKAEAVKAVHNCLNDYVFTAEMAGHAGRHLQLAENAIIAIREQLGEKA